MTSKLVGPTPDASEQLERERERIHRQMLSSVSHDLKTPLASIIGSLEVYERMRDKLPQEKQGDLIRVALEEAYRLDNFITNILDMAKLENGMVKPKREGVDVGHTIRDCVTKLSSLLLKSKVDISALTPDPVEITTDAVLLSRAVCLVLDNAVKYGGKPPVIEIEYGINDDKTGFIRIHDNGRGIPSSEIEAIFSKYTRFSKEDQQNAGTGLGLAIGREIMRLLGGDIRVANADVGGTTFTLNFLTQ